MGRGIVVVSCALLAVSVRADGLAGLLTTGPPAGDLETLLRWSRTQGYAVESVHPWPGGRFKAEGRDAWADLGAYRLLWLDVSDQPAPAADPRALLETWLEAPCREALLGYVRGGGALVVSTMAFRLPADLGIEDAAPDEWGQFDGAATVGYRWEASGGLAALASPLLTGEGAHPRRWMRYHLRVPQQGEVLARHWLEPQYIQAVRWRAGQGRVYALDSLPWLAPANPRLEGAERLTHALLAAAGVSPDPDLARQALAAAEAEQRAQAQRRVEALRLTEPPAAAIPGVLTAEGPYARLTNEGFVIGNATIERRVESAPLLCTTSVWNRLAAEAIPLGSAEFRLAFGREREELCLGPADFRAKGPPKPARNGGQHTVTVALERWSAPALRVEVVYRADARPELSKSLRVTNLSGGELFLREVWIDALRFSETVSVVPYTVFAAFARAQDGGLWLCQDLPYSVPSADAAARWIGVAYPPCEPLPAGSTYESERSYLTAVRLTGAQCLPRGMHHQISSYGPFQDPQEPLEASEIDSCLDFIDAHGSQVRQSHVLHASYHDYATLGPTDFLPYVQGPGGGWEGLRPWLDRSLRHGTTSYLLYPDLGAWRGVPAAEEVLARHVRPHLRGRGMGLSLWFSAYGSSWYSGVGLRDGKPLTTYRDRETQDWLIDTLRDLLIRHQLSGVYPDQAAIAVDPAFDQALGYPGALPLSPSLYREYRAWDRILRELRAMRPDLQWGLGHFGNNQAPLFAGMNTLHYWCEPHDTEREYRSLPDRHPALSAMKAVADGYRREQFWFQRERFVPYRLMAGNVNFQIGTHEASEPTGEPPAQHFRYLLLQNLALHPNAVLWGLDTMVTRGSFGQHEAAFARRWFRFAQEHARELSHRPWVAAGEPRYGTVEVYSYGRRGGGWVFLVNPSFLSARATFSVGPATGFDPRETYAVQEVTPATRWVLTRGRPTVSGGESLTLEVPGYTVMLLRVLPAQEAWQRRREVLFGVERTPGGDLRAAPGEAVEWALYDVRDPARPRQLTAGAGVVPGTSPRLEILDWTAGEGPSGADFSLRDEAGVVLWDLAADPLLDRVVIDPAGLRPQAVGPHGPQHSRPPDSPSGRGWRLEASVRLDRLPERPLLIAQLRQPERATVRIWANGHEQTCARAYNDWCVLEPIGLVLGDNRLAVWVGPVQ